MGAKRISNAMNEKIIALMSIGKTSQQAAAATGVSHSYCNKLYAVLKFVANEQWDELIEYSKTATTGGVLNWACEYLDTSLPQDVTDKLNATRYRYAAEPPESTAIDNTAIAIIKILEAITAATAAITAAADDVCQTVATARKLNEDCINSNFDVLTATLRDGIESLKTTIRKAQK